MFCLFCLIGIYIFRTILHLLSKVYPLQILSSCDILSIIKPLHFKKESIPHRKYFILRLLSFA
nr:MAG TPA: hypothetical protein [Caudoviricetes sp.]